MNFRRLSILLSVTSLGFFFFLTCRKKTTNIDIATRSHWKLQGTIQIHLTIYVHMHTPTPSLIWFQLEISISSFSSVKKLRKRGTSATKLKSWSKQPFEQGVVWKGKSKTSTLLCRVWCPTVSRANCSTGVTVQKVDGGLEQVHRQSYHILSGCRGNALILAMKKGKKK